MVKNSILRVVFFLLGDKYYDTKLRWLYYFFSVSLVIFFLQGLYNSIIGHNIMIFLKATLAVAILCLLCRILLIFIVKINGIK
ncbi:hypothetical protein Y919_11770 [Caloranaerobacter azorensis H53214]|uniref:Uncharacterized protein n=1 Tax=Caloranaerobacter azorensis H53214 TaxID=1156417 RepID=A0A096BEA5_9FIRM|nr:hypothetical protein [Caloranaerobacter azorensis]KGG79485.1 hypothetical protein Y919_11770 [Caloranaerobacter azorensis H53214]